MSNGTIRNAADITAAIDEIIEYLKTGDENWQALMHANLLLTNLMRLLRPIAKPARQPYSRSRYGADQAGFGIPKVGALKEAVIRAISQIEHGHHLAAFRRWQQDGGGRAGRARSRFSCTYERRVHADAVCGTGRPDRHGEGLAESRS